MDVLFVKLLAIGDVVEATAAVAVLRRHNPDVRLTWVCGDRSVSLLKAVPGIDELIIVDERALLIGSKCRQIIQLMKLWCRLGRRQFDLVATGHADPRYRLLTIWVRASRRRAFGSAGRHAILPGRHRIDEYVRLLLGLEGPDLPCGEYPQIEAELPDRLRVQLPNGKPVVAIVPGGTKNTLSTQNLRRWPIAHYRKLAEKLIAANKTVVLTGDNGDVWIRPYFEGLPVVDMLGQTDLLTAIALLRATDLTISHDTGLLHLARLAGTSVLALFGPTPPHVAGPMKRHAPEGRASLSRALWGGEHLACRPCYDGKNYAECRDNVCMASMSPDAVYETAIQILGEQCNLRVR